MSRTSAIVIAFLVLPLAASAQQDEGGFGLDLTSPEESKTPSGENKAQPEQPAPTPPAVLPPDDGQKAAASKESLLEGERDVTVEDRVKSVQRKLYLKKHRFELAPFATYAVNDPYYMKYGLSLRGAWYLQDSLAIAGRFALVNVNPTDDVRTAKRTFQSMIFYSVPQWAAMADVEWSPIYGKIAIFNDIWHFDSYLIGGMGVVNTETSSDRDRGPNPAVDLGVGVRFIARDYLAFNAALINTSYVDAPSGTFKGSTQNLMTLNAGVSIFFPFKSTGQEAQ